VPKAKKDPNADPPIPKDVHKWAEDDLFTFNDYIVLLTAINDLCENPIGNCSDVEKLELPTKPHIYSQKDIEKIREKLEELCFYPPERGTEWEDFWTELEDIKDPGQLWTAGILNEIEDAIDEGWCDCCITCANAHECPEPPAQYDWNQVPFVDSGIEYTPEQLCGYTYTEFWADHVEESANYGTSDHGLFGQWQRHWVNEFIDEGQEFQEAAIEHGQKMYQAYTRAWAADGKYNKWRTLQAGFQVGIDWFEEQKERAQERLEELNKLKDYICNKASDDKSLEGACEKAQEHIEDQEDYIEELDEGADDISAEHDRLEALADEQLGEMESAATEHQALQGSIPLRKGQISTVSMMSNTESLITAWLALEPAPVRWDYPWWKSNPGDCRKRKPRDIKTWVNLIDQDYACWINQPNHCTVSWNHGYQKTGGDGDWEPREDRDVGGWEWTGGEAYLTNGMWVKRSGLVTGHNDYLRRYLWNTTYGWWDFLSSLGEYPYGGVEHANEEVCPGYDEEYNPYTTKYASRLLYSGCECGDREAEPTDPDDKPWDAPPWWETYTGDEE